MGIKQSVSFSKDEVENTSLNFSELREKGIEYIQELSGDVWTDFNSHDPGVTILEQLCYALTDIGFRTSLPVNELLIEGKDKTVAAEKNAFFTPSDIFSSHPVTILDTRKMIIDRFDKIQNVWISTKENKGYQEELRGINQVEILPRINFLNELKSNPGSKETFLKEANTFLSKARNLGENFEPVCLLQPQCIQIDFDIYIKEGADIETAIANLLLKLFEFIYSPVQYHSLSEMEEEVKNVEEIFAGPKLTKGFIKNDLPNQRLKKIHVDELQKLFSKVNGIVKSEVRSIIFNGAKYEELTVENGKFFHLQVDGNTDKKPETRFESIYSSVNVFVNNKIIPSLKKQSISNLFFEIWSKKHRGYSLVTQHAEYFSEKLNAAWRDPGNYHSIQRHFPIIYGIGEEGISKNDSAERHSRANQLKAYLILFEQHLTNHLAQLANLNEFFNINYTNGVKNTYFTQWLSSVPSIDKLMDKNQHSINSHEPHEVFFRRKNKIYDHMLARFGEDLSNIPWETARRLNLIKSDAEFNEELLKQKSEFLTQLKDLSYNRAKGESFQPGNGDEFTREPSGLEQIISIKTGIPLRENTSLIPDLDEQEDVFSEKDGEHYNTFEELNKKYKSPGIDEINNAPKQNNNTTIPVAKFGKIGLKTLFKETLNHKNYRLSVPESSDEKVSVIFQKEPDRWSRLFDKCDNETEAIQNICRIMNYFIEKNKQSEGLYIVDHILLSEFLEDSKYGFSFRDEYGIPIFQTSEEQSWCNTQEERNIRLSEFYQHLDAYDPYIKKEGKWSIKNNEGKIIASYFTPEESVANNTNEIITQATSLIHLFGDSEDSNGRIRFKEMEKIRFMGSISRNAENYGQRRLIFQRKLATGEIIDEDFFDMNVTILLPDWPARFQDERFNSYLNDLIIERIPGHIGNQILWINKNQMEEFEKEYFAWEKLKVEYYHSGSVPKKLPDAAFKVYQKLMEIKTNN